MRHLLLAALLAAPSAAADPTPRDVVEAAVKAHGGKEALAKAARGSQKMAGTMSVQGVELEFTGDVLYALPDKYKLTLTLTHPGSKLVATQVANGDKTKTVLDGKPVKLSEAMRAELRQSAVNQEISLLTALLDDKKYALKLGPAGKVGDVEVVTVVVSAKGLTDVTLSFEKSSGRLVRLARTAAGADEKLTPEETTFAEFKDVDGVQLPTKLTVTRGGKKFMAATVSEVKWLDKIDDKTFEVDE